MNAIAQTNPMQKNIRVQEIQFLPQCCQPLILTLKNIAIHIRKMLGEQFRIGRIVANFRNQGIQAVKQKVRIQLIL